VALPSLLLWAKAAATKGAVKRMEERIAAVYEVEWVFDGDYV
jgi:hypothetical protein